MVGSTRKLQVYVRNGCKNSGFDAAKKLASCKALAHPSVHETRLLLLLLASTRCFRLVNDLFGLWLKSLLRSRTLHSEPYPASISHTKQQLCNNNDPSTVRRTATGVLQRLVPQQEQDPCLLHTPPMYTRCTDGARVA